MNVLVALPVYNEQRHLLRVLDAVGRYSRSILVVDDGSTDTTPTLLARRKGLHRIRHPENRGYGQSLMSAFEFARRRRFDWVVTLDCDEQHEPAQIPRFLDEIRRDQADVISGSRYLQPCADDDPPPPERYLINRTITLMLRQILGLDLTDAFCGFKAYRLAALRRLSLDEPGYAFPIQFWVQSACAALKLRELPVRRIYRDRSRTFGGTLDDPAERMQHYLEVLVRELRRAAVGRTIRGEATAAYPCRLKV